MFELGQYQPFDIRRIIGGVGVPNPRPNVMGDDVDSSRGREVGRFKEAMQVACGGVEIVTSGRLVAVTKAARVEDDDATPRADQQRHHLPPGEPGLGPPWQQQYRIAGPSRHVVEARALDFDNVVFDLALGGAACCEHDASRDYSNCRGRGTEEMAAMTIDAFKPTKLSHDMHLRRLIAA